MTYNLLYAADNKCVSCHEGVCIGKTNNCVLCHRGNNTTTRKEIAHYKLITGKYASYKEKNNIKTLEGIKIIEQAACTRCHNIGKKGATLASDLNSAVKRLTTADLVRAIKEPAINMPYFQFNNGNMEKLITAVYYYTIPEESKSITQIVHLQDNAGSNDLFRQKCGTCHKAITNNGAIGSSDNAPNLSSLPKVYSEYLNGKNWDKTILDKWMINPRSLKNNAVMPIIELSDEEKKNIIDILIE